MRFLPVFAVFLLCGILSAADHPEIALWDHGAPGSEGKIAAEVDEAPNQAHGYLKVTQVHKPSLTVCLPPEFEPSNQVARRLAKVKSNTAGSLQISHDAFQTCKSAHQLGRDVNEARTRKHCDASQSRFVQV